MRAGQLRHRITIQQKSATRTASGAESVTWSTFATVWASIEPLNGRELEYARQLHDEASFRFWIRHYAGVVPEMRVSWDSRLFDIVYVENTAERDIKMRLTCREVT